jgi:hypothetical protein
MRSSLREMGEVVQSLQTEAAVLRGGHGCGSDFTTGFRSSKGLFFASHRQSCALRFYTVTASQQSGPFANGRN